MAKKKKKLISFIIAIILYVAVYSIPTLVIFKVIDVSAITLSWILIIILALVGAERLYVAFKHNAFWRLK